jgi:hypothetical protein
MNLFAPGQFTQSQRTLQTLLVTVVVIAGNWSSAVAQTDGDHSNFRHGVAARRY